MAAADVQMPQKVENGVETPAEDAKSFTSRLYELPVVMAAMEQLSQIYGNVKERNAVTKKVCEAGESTLSVATAASKPLIQKATNTAFTLAKPVIGEVNDPVSTIDNVASETLAKVEEKFPVITKTPTEIAEMTKMAVTGRAYSAYDNIQNMSVTKMLTSKASDVVSFTELMAEIALPTDGNCEEDIKELETADKDSDKGVVVRATHLGKRVTRRGKRTLMQYKPVQMTIDAVNCAQERLTGIVEKSTETSKKVYEAYLYFPETATKISGEVVVSAKEFVFAFANAHPVKDLPAAVLNLTKTTMEPIASVKDKALAYVFVPSNVIAEYVLSSRPVQWIIPHIVSEEDLSKLEISMEEIEDEPASEEEVKQ
ncbi:predicted protein [Nematostella vectensis]|uniref:Perilipin n=1 Tax=Nematostella vectensis TaxID=45351 RepID=A7SZB9_NEMVE|nr:uncharacterized protein LOC5501794 [Nematostella vectensis]EDO30954.1 predicted protein [Nematostella vectensis]|eukprot:XP_001623054.1 predicted protein [Nematostella vectensis]